ncbi:dialkylrecorsinol condensing enzyme [Eikenella corrodens]|uniref:dialkylrecorsinol condensing enzyme n=1 Tax=Eikenella corrodens TaxID=539 RepID=UPI0012ACFA0D|nr:dialkylrecorsinol condensing enzyme [Eikenella corrodens]
MSKRVLVVSYSQSGQLARLKESFLRDIRGAAGVEVDDVVLQPARPFAFPWRFLPFFDAFPETVHLQPAPIERPVLAHERYDLVVIAYSVWFLSPAQPITAFLQSAAAQRVLRDTPVITLIGCRNMWLMAQEKMKRLLADAGARLVGNVVKIDQCGSAASFITTPLWMFTGKRQAVHWLPPAGISEAEIADAARFGQRTAEALQHDETLDKTLLQHMGAVKINEKLMSSERVGHRSFLVWGKLVMAAGRVSPLLRRLVLCVYIVFLLGMILTVVPIGALLKTLLAPLRREQMQREREYYAAPSGE